jgi:hypothetical protein
MRVHLSWGNLGIMVLPKYESVSLLREGGIIVLPEYEGVFLLRGVIMGLMVLPEYDYMSFL